MFSAGVLAVAYFYRVGHNAKIGGMKFFITFKVFYCAQHTVILFAEVLGYFKAGGGGFAIDEFDGRFTGWCCHDVCSSSLNEPLPAVKRGGRN